MRDGFVKVCAVTPEVRVADTEYNGSEIRRLMHLAAEQEHAKLVVFPELCITGYTCQDLFWQDALLEASERELMLIASESKTLDALFFVGLPMDFNGNLYNVAAAVCRGKVLAIIPKIYLPNYNEFYEARHFTSGSRLSLLREFKDGDERYEAEVGSRVILQCESMPQLRVAAELCEDLWTPDPPGTAHALAGANVIVNLSASDEITGKSIYRKDLVSGQSARLICGYVYASAGEGESTQDVVYSGHNLIAQNGRVLAESERFTTGMICAELDVKRLESDRRRMSTFATSGGNSGYRSVSFPLEISETILTQPIDPAPFVPSDEGNRKRRCEEILMIQATGLKKRLRHTNCRCAVIGISGGLDSTLALIVAAKAFDLLGMDRTSILAVTMPGFGTTDRTYDNAVRLVNCLGAELMEVSIRDAVNLHFRDIGQSPELHDVTYENAQARERTQILMDLANKRGGMVIGTGDLSELALGWATYNGDHMSMYAVNASVPKTLVRHLVRYYADTCGDALLEQTLLDVLDTPVSPELLPPSNGEISQKTEDLVGPYELHDFFLYHMLRCNSNPGKIYRLAKLAFRGTYSDEFIMKWLKNFYRRFFAQHFKRSCLPDGPKVGTVAVSPRGDLRMPSDAVGRVWLKELEEL